MKLTLEITMDNAAFDPTNGYEAARITRALAKMIDGERLGPGWYQSFVDTNGNRTAEARVTD